MTSFLAFAPGAASQREVFFSAFHKADRNRPDATRDRPAAQVPNAVGNAVGNRPGVAVGRQQAVRTQRAIRDTTAAVQAGTATVAAAIADAAQRDELTAAQIVEVQDNLQDAPLTSQLVAQGRIKLGQVLDPAEVASYEKALRDRRVKLDSDGRETVQRGARLAAQPVLTRYVADPDTGGRKWRGSTSWWTWSGARPSRQPSQMNPAQRPCAVHYTPWQPTYRSTWGLPKP
jgi:hypothetical protein